MRGRRLYIRRPNINPDNIQGNAMCCTNITSIYRALHCTAIQKSRHNPRQGSFFPSALGEAIPRPVRGRKGRLQHVQLLVEGDDGA